MMDHSGRIIYVGKAKNIKKRVMSYFGSSRGYKTTCLVADIHHIQPVVTKTEHDALLLENSLIKQYQPKYNILLKDDKTYPYIKITMKEAFPRIIVTRQKKQDGSVYFGPYTSYGSIRQLRKTLYRVFPIRDCKQTIDLVSIQKKCIKLDIGQCIGPCIYKNITDDYNELIQSCIQFLSGRSDDLIHALRKKMMGYAQKKAYEQAAVVRDQIDQLMTIQSQQHIELDSNAHHFFIGVASNDHTHYGICQHYANKRFVSQMGKYADASMTCHDFLMQFIDTMLTMAPQSLQLVLDKQYSLDPALLAQHRRLNMKVMYPTKGRYAQWVSIAQLNAQKALMGVSKDVMTPLLTCPLTLLKNDLKLNHRPSIIMGCDISHYYGQGIVSSVVVFVDGQPDKKMYRHFHIRSVTDGKSNDVKSMHETVQRLVAHYDIHPNLLLIDGGKGQLNAAVSALRQAGIATIDCIGLAKKNEVIYTPWQRTPICLAYHHRGLNVLRFVRDEAHRFALNFQRKTRIKRLHDE